MSNILEEMRIEQGRADVAARLEESPAHLEQRYKMARAGATGAGVLFGVSILSGQTWLGAFLPIAAAGLLALQEIKKRESSGDQQMFNKGRERREFLFLAAAAAGWYTLAFTPLDLLAWFSVHDLLRMPVLADLMQYGMMAAAVWFGLSQMRLYQHMIAEVREKRAGFSGK